MIVLPISGDHLDNAQRIAEKGYGLKLDTHQFKDEQLLEAIEKGLYDETIRSKVAAAYKRIVEEKSKEVACQRIEDLVQKGDNWKGNGRLNLIIIYDTRVYKINGS